MRRASSKLSEDLYERVYKWHVEGCSSVDISNKLKVEHGISIERKAIDKLLHRLREEKQKRTESVLADRIVSSIEKDYADIQKLEDRLERLAVSSLKDDHRLFLQVADRQIRVKMLKMGIATAKGNNEDMQIKRDMLLENLISKASRRS